MNSLVLFPEDKPFGDYTFKKNKVYYIKDFPAEFVQRWVKRGCTIVEYAEEILPDPRYPEIKTPEFKAPKKKVDKPKEKVETVIEEKVEVAVEEKVEAPKPKKKAKTKKQK